MKMRMLGPILCDGGRKSNGKLIKNLIWTKSVLETHLAHFPIVYRRVGWLDLKISKDRISTNFPAICTSYVELGVLTTN